jgi:predicted RNA methylase
VIDRKFLLSGRKRNEVLTLHEVEQYGRDSFGDPDYVRLYGLKPAAWHARGVRLLGRTAVECTRDRLAEQIADDIAWAARTAPGRLEAVVVDPFAGSGNTLFWLKRKLAVRCVGFELDDGVFALTRRNLELVGESITFLQEDYEAGLGRLDVAGDGLLVAFVAPPWGDALSETAGLDLRRTAPPVAQVVDLIAASFGDIELLIATQVFERVERCSLEELTGRFDWSALKIYDIDPPGRNHGLLLGTHGWRPAST